MTGNDRLNIIQNAIEDLELTEEPIKKYYKLDKVLGAGKYGVVKLGYSKSMIVKFLNILHLPLISSKYSEC